MLIERETLEIEKLEREIAKLSDELSKQKRISAIERERAVSKSKQFGRWVTRLQKDLDNLKVFAPNAGYVVHTERFQRDLQSFGGKLPKGRPFARIPDLNTIELIGAIPEHQRPFVAVGDSATVRLVGSQQLEYQGTVIALDDIAQDMNDLKAGSWGSQDSESGIKVYSLRIHVDADSRAIRPGMHGEALIRSASPHKGLGIPVDYAVHKDGFWHIAVDGVYRRVQGRVIDEWFFFEDKHADLAGESVTYQGVWPLREDVLNQTEGQSSGRIIAGEVSPTQQYKVFARNARRGQK